MPPFHILLLPTQLTDGFAPRNTPTSSSFKVLSRQGPLRGLNPLYSQLYFLDPTEATNIRFTNNPSLALDHSLLSDLDHFFQSENPFSHMFRRARDVLDENPGLSSLRLNPQLRLITTQHDDPCWYNLPTVNHELAAVISDISSEFGQRSYWDVILYLHHADSAEYGSLKHIYPNHALYLPLHYVLFYPTGSCGYHKTL
jgi:hypothetical protein